MQRRKTQGKNGSEIAPLWVRDQLNGVEFYSLESPNMAFLFSVHVLRTSCKCVLMSCGHHQSDLRELCTNLWTRHIKKNLYFIQINNEEYIYMSCFIIHKNCTVDSIHTYNYLQQTPGRSLCFQLFGRSAAICSKPSAVAKVCQATCSPLRFSWLYQAHWEMIRQILLVTS